MRCEPPPPPPAHLPDACLLSACPSPRGPRPSQRFIPTSRSWPGSAAHTDPPAPPRRRLASGAHPRRDGLGRARRFPLRRSVRAAAHPPRAERSARRRRVAPHAAPPRAPKRASSRCAGRETLKAKQLAPPLQLVLQLMTLLRAQPPAAAALARRRRAGAAAARRPPRERAFGRHAGPPRHCRDEPGGRRRRRRRAGAQRPRRQCEEGEEGEEGAPRPRRGPLSNGVSAWRDRAPIRFFIYT